MSSTADVFIHNCRSLHSAAVICDASRFRVSVLSFSIKIKIALTLTALPVIFISSITHGADQTIKGAVELCDDEAVEISELIIRPSDVIDTNYSISFGRFPFMDDSHPLLGLLDARGIEYELVKVRDEACNIAFLVTHGSFSNRDIAYRTMWRLLSFPNPGNVNNITLSGYIVKKPKQDK